MNTFPFASAAIFCFDTLPSSPSAPVALLNTPAIALNATSVLPLSAASFNLGAISSAVLPCRTSVPAAPNAPNVAFS